VAERLLFVPTWLISPNVCEKTPALRAAIDELRASFEVDVFVWPSLRGGGDFPPTWEGGVEALRAAFTPGCHLVVMAETPQALVALSRDDEGVATFIADGMWTPPATLRALGRLEEAAAAVSTYRGRSYQWVRLYMQGGTEEEWTRAADLMDQDIDWSYLGKLAPSYMALDLVIVDPRVQIPTLYFDSPLELISYSDMTEVFRHFVPHAEVQRLPSWPSRMQDAQTGIDFARRVTEFVWRSSRAPADGSRS
jgi:hypothetical protein